MKDLVKDLVKDLNQIQVKAILEKAIADLLVQAEARRKQINEEGDCNFDSIDRFWEKTLADSLASVVSTLPASELPIIRKYTIYEIDEMRDLIECWAFRKSFIDQRSVWKETERRLRTYMMASVSIEEIRSWADQQKAIEEEEG